MNSFLAELEKYYYLFDSTSGQIIDLFHFSKDINNTWRYLLVKANKKYFKNCTELRRNTQKFAEISIKKDLSGKCYLEVVGNDNHTILIIRQNDSKYEDYRQTTGTKITEADFVKELDFIQRKRLEEAKIPSRFLREQALPIDICQEMNIPLLIDYYKYIDEYNNPLIMYDEPTSVDNSIRSPRSGNPTTPRKNPIIPYELRRAELLKRNPKRILKFGGNNTGTKVDAYLYERNDQTLVVVEPISGMEYQYNLNLGFIDKEDSDYIKETILTAIELPEEIVMLDDAIIRKNHTTIESFSDSLDIFLESAKKTTKFYYDTQKAKAVYQKK